MTKGALEQLNFKPSVLAEQIADTLTQAILDDTLKEGQQLIEADLQKQFGISRSPLREAFRDLEKRQLVVIIPRKGTFVKRTTQKDIEENIPIRAVLESLAAKEAYNRMTEQDLKCMEEALNYMRKSTAKTDTRTYWKNHLIFHNTFIKASGNDMLINLLHTLNMNSNRNKLSHHFYLEDFDENLAEHEQIFALFQDKEKDNSRKVSKLIHHHIDNSLKTILKFIKKNEP